MKQYTVSGMSCAACQAHVEKAVAAVPGVDSVAVSLLTNSMSVEEMPPMQPSLQQSKRPATAQRSKAAQTCPGKAPQRALKPRKRL